MSTSACDWRINVYDCNHSQYFFNVHVASAVMAFVTCLTTTLVLVYRIAIRKDGARTLLYGANFATVAVAVETLVNFIHHLFVLVLPNNEATGVFWAATVALSSAPSAVYLLSIVEALPDHLFQSKNAVKLKEMLPGEVARNRILFSFQTFLLLVSLILFPLSFYYSIPAQGGTINPGLALALFQAGATILAVSLFAYMAVFLVFAQGFLSIMKAYLKISPDELLNMTRKKMINIVTVMTMIALVFAVTLLLIAYYPDFFSDAPVSMAFGFLQLLIVEICALLGLVSVIKVDVEKYKAAARTSSHHSSSHHNNSGAVNLTEKANGDYPMEKVKIGATVVTF